MEEIKKSILIFVDWYAPGYKAGGPIRSIEGFVSCFKDDYRLYIVTRDRDFGEKCKYENITSDKWIQIAGGVNVLYLRSGFAVKTLINKIQPLNFDWVYLNSFFSPQFSIIPSLLFKLKLINSSNLLIAPRGEFEPSRLGVKSLKKNIYLIFAKVFGIYNNAKWHATSSSETGNIMKIMKGDKILQVPNLKKWNRDSVFDQTKEQRNLDIVFISRIIPYKNLLRAIDIIDLLSDEIIINFDIYGPIEDSAYFNNCMDKAKLSRHNIKYKGELNYRDVNSKLSLYHCFLFPTLGENFGHVIAEALMAGCVPIISDQTPWNDLNEEGAGWALPLNNFEVFAEKVQEMYEMNENNFLLKQQKIKEYLPKKLNNPAEIEKYKLFFNNSVLPVVQ